MFYGWFVAASAFFTLPITVGSPFYGGLPAHRFSPRKLILCGALAGAVAIAILPNRQGQAFRTASPLILIPEVDS